MLVMMFVLSSGSLAQGRLPFTGTRTFCGVEIDGTMAVVSIREDGVTTVRTNMWTDEVTLGSRTYRYVSFSGRLNAKGILRRNRDMYLQVKSGTDIVMMAPQDYITGRLCTSRDVPPEKGQDVQRTLAAPANARSKRKPAIQPAPNSVQGSSLEEMVRKYGGTYSIDCRKSTAYQANITVDALTLRLGSKQLRGVNPTLGGLLPIYKYIMTDPSLKVAFSADVAPNVRMSFTVYDDKEGPYLLVIGHRRIEDAVQVDKDADERPMFRKCQ